MRNQHCYVKLKSRGKIIEAESLDEPELEGNQVVRLKEDLKGSSLELEEARLSLT